MIGNLSLEDIVEPRFLDEVRGFLDENGYKHTSKCDDVSKREGNYHIYHIPMIFSICGEAKVKQFIEFIEGISTLEDAFSRSLGLATEKLKEKPRKVFFGEDKEEK